MGWLTIDEQKRVRKKYKMYSLYKCNHCGRPISILELAIINPKGGYYSWKTKGTPRNCRTFMTKEPKVTYHQECNNERLGITKKIKKLKEKYMAKKEKKANKKKGKKEKKSVKADSKVMKAVLSLISKKPGHYVKNRIFAKFKDKYEKADVRSALSALWSKKDIRKKNNKYILVEE